MDKSDRELVPPVILSNEDLIHSLHEQSANQKVKTSLDDIAPEPGKKNGLRGLFFDPAGSQYAGEWVNDAPHGHGLWVRNKDGLTYEGDFRCGYRHGRGRLSIDMTAQPRQASSLKPTSNFDEEKRIAPRKIETMKLRTIYEGQWKRNQYWGDGIWFGEDQSKYTGQWKANKKHGKGRMKYADGSIYEGDWEQDQRHGYGILRLSNGDYYQGNWKNDKKDGDGKYFYKSRGRVLVGEWAKDVAKCGELRDIKLNKPDSTIPKLELIDPVGVLEEAKSELAASRQRDPVIAEQA